MSRKHLWHHTPLCAIVRAAPHSSRVPISSITTTCRAQPATLITLVELQKSAASCRELPVLPSQAYQACHHNVQLLQRLSSAAGIAQVPSPHPPTHPLLHWPTHPPQACGSPPPQSSPGAAPLGWAPGQVKTSGGELYTHFTRSWGHFTPSLGQLGTFHTQLGQAIAATGTSADTAGYALGGMDAISGV
jgi:hypothetical protein